MLNDKRKLSWRNANGFCAVSGLRSESVRRKNEAGHDQALFSLEFVDVFTCVNESKGMWLRSSEGGLRPPD